MIDGNDIVNGLYGFVYDESGRQVETSQEFTTRVEFEKSEYKLPGRFLSVHKVKGGKGTGTLSFLMTDSGLKRKIAENPNAKYNYLGKLADPTVDGEEAVMYKGVSFDSAPIQGWKTGDDVELSVDFTFEDYDYIDSI